MTATEITPLQAPAGVWLHTEPTGVVGAIEDGYRIGLSAAWNAAARVEQNRAFRGLLIETSAVQARLVGKVTEQPGKAPEVLIDPRPTPGAPVDRLSAAGVLGHTWAILAARTQAGGAQTEGQSSDVGALPAIAVIAIVVVGAAALSYCAHQASAVIDRQLSRDADARKLTQVHTTALELTRAHVEREQEAGKQIPLDAATKSVLQGLNAAQVEIAKKTETPLPPVGGLAQDLGAAAQRSATAFGLSAGVLAVAGGLFLYFTR